MEPIDFVIERIALRAMPCFQGSRLRVSWFSVGAAFQPRSSRLEASSTTPKYGPQHSARLPIAGIAVAAEMFSKLYAMGLRGVKPTPGEIDVSPGSGRMGSQGRGRGWSRRDGLNKRQFPLSPAAMFWLMLMMMVSFSGLG